MICAGQEQSAKSSLMLKVAYSASSQCVGIDVCVQEAAAAAMVVAS